MYRVLLVDDEEMVTQGLARFVSWDEAGFTVAGTATSVARALTFLESEPADLVIADIQMPVQNGIELIRILKEQYPHIKSIVLSAYSEFSYAQQALRLGALDYLTKPVNFGAMKALLEQVRITLDKENRRESDNDRVQELFAQTLIINLSNGYPYDETRAAACLNITCPITAVRVMARRKTHLPDTLAANLQHTFRPCRTISLGEQGLLMVLESPHSSDSLRNDLSKHLEQYAGSFQLCAGISEQHEGYHALRKAALQAGKAMRYQNARDSYGVLHYAQLKGIFMEANETSNTAIQDLIHLLSVPEKRPQLIEAFSGALYSLETRASFSLAKAQRFCTEFLVELDMPIQNFSLPDYQHHKQLSEIIMDVLNAQTLSEMNDTIARYLGQILEKLKLVGETALAGELIERVKQYIQVHFAEDVTLSVLAEIFYVSPVYLSRLFKKKTGTNFIDYLTALRLEKAKDLLKNSTLKVFQIAEMTGYENPRYFSRLFKESTGCTPQDYRIALHPDETDL